MGGHGVYVASRPNDVMARDGGEIDVETRDHHVVLFVTLSRCSRQSYDHAMNNSNAVNMTVKSTLLPHHYRCRAQRLETKIFVN